MRGGILPVVRGALHVNSGDDAVAILQIRLHLFEHVALGRVFPKVVMGIDDRQVRPQHRLVMQGKPVRAVGDAEKHWILIQRHRQAVVSSIRG